MHPLAAWQLSSRVGPGHCGTRSQSWAENKSADFNGMVRADYPQAFDARYPPPARAAVGFDRVWICSYNQVSRPGSSVGRAQP